MELDMTARSEPLDVPVSVIIPAFNAERTIEETLVSARSQTHKALEIIVVDDGSTDGTAEIVAGHAASDPRIRLVQQRNEGVASARNRGISAASGEFIAPLDADDIWHPSKIERQLEVFAAEGPSTGLIYTWFALIDAESHVLQVRAGRSYRGKVLPNLAFYNFIGNGSSPLIRKSALAATAGYDAGLRERGGQGCEDWKLYFQLAKHCDFGVVPAPLTGYRLLSHNMSSDGVQMLRSRDLAIADLIADNPELRPIFRAGRNRLSRSLFHRALRQRRIGAALAIAGAIATHDPLFFARVIACLPVAVAKGAIGRAFGFGEYRKSKSLHFLELGPAETDDLKVQPKWAPAITSAAHQPASGL